MVFVVPTSSFCQCGAVFPNNYKFTGKECDPESNLDNFEARYYASAMGRFMQSDEFTGGPIDAFTGEGETPGPLPNADIFYDMWILTERTGKLLGTI